MAFAFADRSTAMEVVDVAGVSRLPCGRFPTVRVVYDSVGAISNSPLTPDTAVAFPPSGRGRPHKRMFSELNTLPDCASVNASRRRLLDATHHSRSERPATPYPVRLFHPLPSAGLRRRTLTPFIPCALSEWERFGVWRQAEQAERVHPFRAVVANYQGFNA